MNKELNTKQRQYLNNLLARQPKSEAQLQSKCAELLYFFYPDHWKRFVTVHNNSLRANTMGFGIVQGATDTYWLADHGRVKFIEFKFGPRGCQSEAQVEFMQLCDTLGHKYYICDSEALFWLIIDFKQPCADDIEKVLSLIECKQNGQ